VIDFRVFSSRLLLAGQSVLTAIVLAAAVLLPHVGDPVLMLPVTRQAARDLSGRLFDGKTLVLGAGPVSGSFVTVSTNDRAWGTFIAMGVLPLAYPQALCGEPRDG
jgi:hypothetical protein